MHPCPRFITAGAFIAFLSLVALPLCPAPHISTWLPISRAEYARLAKLKPDLLDVRSPGVTSQLYGVSGAAMRHAIIFKAEDRAKMARTNVSTRVLEPRPSASKQYVVKPVQPSLGEGVSNMDTDGKLPTIRNGVLKTKPHSDATRVLRATEREGMVDVELQGSEEIMSTKSLLNKGDGVERIELNDDEGGVTELKASAKELDGFLDRTGGNCVRVNVAHLKSVQLTDRTRALLAVMLCRPRLRIVLRTKGGGLLTVPFRPYIVVSWAHCCRKPSVNFHYAGTRWYHDIGTGSCRRTRNVLVGIFTSKASCERRCCTATSPCNRDCREPRSFVDGASGVAGGTVGSWDYSNGKIIAEHGRRFWCGGRRCSCDNGEIVCAQDTCARRKNIRYTWASERDSLVDAMHWVKDGCPTASDSGASLPLATPKCQNPDTGAAGWSLATFFEEHITYSGSAHGVAGFFPWHRKYLKEYESVLQQFNKCVMLPYWDWTQDSGNEDAIPWLSHCDPTVTSNGGVGCPLQAPSTHDDIWGKLGKASNSGPSYLFGDAYGGMPSGRFRCDATQPLNTQWNLNSYALGSSAAQNGASGPYPCLFRNSRMNVAIPSLGTVNSYLAASSYQQLMGFEGAPHGMPQVMIGGTGQMGNSRSPYDPLFWIHHTGVDKLWYDWQNSDPAHFWDYGYFGGEALTDKLGGFGT